MTVRGLIKDQAPVLTGRVDRRGKLCLGGRGPHRFIVDTGFTGAVAVPEEMLSSLNVEHIGYDTFMLATGQEVELPVFLGEVKIGHRRVQTWFIAGDHLIGMEFLGVAFSLFQIDFRRGTWALEPR